VPVVPDRFQEPKELMRRRRSRAAGTRITRETLLLPRVCRREDGKGGAQGILSGKVNLFNDNAVSGLLEKIGPTAARFPPKM
jgi:hypothetical protein